MNAANDDARDVLELVSRLFHADGLITELAERIDRLEAEIDRRPTALGRLYAPSCTPALRRRIFRRMPRMQVYLPDDLYQQVKQRRLPASELLQTAVRAELRRQELLEQTDTYLAELVAEVGEPSPRQLARAGAIARRIADHHARQAG